MPQEPEKENTDEKLQEKTLAEIFYYLPSPRARRELEEFRIKFEAEHGETDITKHYTSFLPKEQQAWLEEHATKRYWDGLPPFVQAFMRSKMIAAGKSGKLDDMPDAPLRLYISGQMTVGNSRDDGFQR